jgi:hypothetical protein
MWGNSNLTAFTIGVGMAVAMVGRPADGGVVAQSIVQSTPIDVQLGPYTGVLTFDPFDDMNGTRTLNEVTLSINGTVSLNFAMENGSPFFAPNVVMLLGGFGHARLGGTVAQMNFTSLAIPPEIIGPTDGIPGSGPDYWSGSMSTMNTASIAFDSDMLPTFTQGQSIPINVFLNPTAQTAGLPQGTTAITMFMFAGAVDLSYQYNCAHACPADVTPAFGAERFGNGEVNIDDLIAVLNGYGSEVKRLDMSPVNSDCTLGDGAVTVDEIISVINAFGPCPPVG